MKTLYLLRHAKSSWDDANISDHQRPLNSRGRSDAALMGEVLFNRGVVPDLIFSSTAARAVETAGILLSHMDFNADAVEKLNGLYSLDMRGILEVVKGCPDTVSRLMLIGHNPSIVLLADWLAKERVGDMPTCCCAALEFNINSWAKLEKGEARLMFLEYPKKHH